MRTPTAAALVVMVLVLPPALAAAGVPALAGAPAARDAAMLPTPGVFCELAEPATGRLFPEPEQSNDFVSYDEALCGLHALAERHPDRVRVVKVADSVGWSDLRGGHQQFDVFVVEVTRFDEGPAFEDKPKIVFQLSIHGNEKGGREGGLRVIEDFARDIGLATARPDLSALLADLALVFVFPNPDGWTHEELQYRHNEACYYQSPGCRLGLTRPGSTPGTDTQNFVRTNGHGVDLNRQYPTSGWVRESHRPMSEPEVVGLVDFKLRYQNVRLASDIHGMMAPANMKRTDCLDPDLHLAPGACDPEGRGHFVLTMLPAGRQEPREMAITTTLAERVKQTLNDDPYFAEWQALPGFGAWGGEFNDWGTVWDTLGYTDSGFTSDWYAQDIGLDVPGVDFELAYNHVSFDNYYPGVAQRMNMYHVHAVRSIVGAFMEHAALEHAYRVETNGMRAAYLQNPVVVTNEGALGVDGHAKENTLDDAYDTAHVTFRAAADDYWLDLAPHLPPGALEHVTPAELTADRLAAFDSLVVAGSAYRTLAGNAAALAAVRAFVEAGGTLVATDEGLRLLEDLGIVPPGGAKSYETYAGYSNFVDRSHDLLADVRGLARETYEPVPLGFTLQSGGAAPIWYVDADDYDGEVVGVGGRGQAATPDESRVTFGRAALGEGAVVFLGAFLPDPTREFYHPYGLDSYATTYTSNQILRNALGWTEVVETAPLGTLASAATAGAAGATVPAPGTAPAVLAAGLVALALAAHRRRR